MSDDPEISKLVEELHRLFPTAKVHGYSALFPAARTHECHSNADQFVSNNDGYRVVRGWLFFDSRCSAIGSPHKKETVMQPFVTAESFKSQFAVTKSSSCQSIERARFTTARRPYKGSL
jgi:hypothetical protein